MNTLASPKTPSLHMPVTKRAYGRSLADFGDLLPAEKKLLEGCARGRATNIGSKVPSEGTDANLLVRASFLRFLLLGGDEQAPVHEQGVQLIGACIKGKLDLENCFVPHRMALTKCRFDEPIIARDAHIAGPLFLSGSHLQQGLNAERLRCNSAVHFQNRFRSFAEVRLIGAQIGGSLTCSGGLFEPKAGNALSADRCVIKGSVFLNNQFKATGTVRLVGVQIGGNLDCSGGQFLVQIEDVLNLQTSIIQDGFIFRDLAAPIRIIATSAEIGVLVDEPTAWAKGSILNGLVYRSIAGTAPTDAAHRIAWLKQQSDKDLGEDAPKQGFRPQPWKQLQKVLREMGHAADAREVGVAFEEQLRRADRIGQITDARKAKKIIPVVRRQFLRGLHWLFGALAGYGYRPMRLFTSMVVVWLLCALAYWWLALSPRNALGPTDPLIFQHSDYAACAAANKGNWFLCGPLPAEYTTFSPLAYSLDILLPLVDLGQEKSWGPLVPTPQQPFYVELFTFSPAHWVRLLNWFEILYGWVASLLFVAIVSGMSRRSEVEK